MDRRHLHVLVLVLPPVVGSRVLDSNVWELDVPSLARQAMLTGPVRDLFPSTIGPAVAVGATSDPLLKEPLIVALELVVQDDTFDPAAVLLDPLGGALVRP